MTGTKKKLRCLLAAAALLLLTFLIQPVTAYADDK